MSIRRALMVTTLAAMPGLVAFASGRADEGVVAGGGAAPRLAEDLVVDPQGEAVEASDAGTRPEIRVPELDCTPVAAAGFRKGRKFPITLVRIDGGWIERSTADAYWAMREAAAADGIELTIYSAFRSAEEQAYFYGCYRTCACNSCSPAARPGFSNHQSGHALDIASWPEGAHPWLARNAARFGFVATVKSEPWHWEYRKPKRALRGRACPREPARPDQRNR